MFLQHTTEDKNAGQVGNLSYDYYFRGGKYDLTRYPYG